MLKDIDSITNKTVRDLLEERIHKKNEKTEDYADLQEIVDSLTVWDYLYPIITDWHIYLGIQQCKQCWDSGMWNQCWDCDLEAEKSNDFQRTVCCSVEYPWSDLNKKMSPSEKKYRIENSMSDLDNISKTSLALNSICRSE